MLLKLSNTELHCIPKKRYRLTTDIQNRVFIYMLVVLVYYRYQFEFIITKEVDNHWFDESQNRVGQNLSN